MVVFEVLEGCHPVAIGADNAKVVRIDASRDIMISNIYDTALLNFQDFVTSGFTYVRYFCSLAGVQ